MNVELANIVKGMRRTVEMTMRYAHLSPEVGRGAVLLLDGPARPTVDRSGHDLGTIGTKIPT